MSDGQKTADESAIERVLAALEGGTETEMPNFADLDEEAQTLGRLYVEAVGLYPVTLEVQAAPAELKTRVLEALREPSQPPQQIAANVATGSFTPLADGGTTSSGGHRVPSRVGARSVEKSYSTGGQRPVPANPEAHRARPRARRWPLALAALLSLAFAGLAGWLFVQLEESRSQQVRVEGRLRGLASQVETLQTAQSELVRTRETIRMVTSRGASVCSLRSLDATRAAAASGVMYVDAARSRWYLVMDGLDPVPAEHDYQLWFLVDGRPVSGGTFPAHAGQRIELSAQTLPRGANAVAVTIEPRGGLPLPTGPMVLLGDQIRTL